jgi:hypothetical protein
VRGGVATGGVFKAFAALVICAWDIAELKTSPLSAMMLDGCAKTDEIEIRIWLVPCSAQDPGATVPATQSSRSIELCLPVLHGATECDASALRRRRRRLMVLLTFVALPPAIGSRCPTIRFGLMVPASFTNASPPIIPSNNPPPHAGVVEALWISSSSF